MDSTPAILLRRSRLTETSLIISWMSLSAGRIRTVAKGARQNRSRFAGVLDLFYGCEIEYVRSRKSELHVLREAQLLKPREQIRTDHRRVALGAYFVELLELVTEPEHAAPELYDLLDRALSHIDEKPATVKALRHFERELVRLLGIHEAGSDSAAALARTYHKLPMCRRNLERDLP